MNNEEMEKEGRKVGELMKAIKFLEEEKEKSHKQGVEDCARAIGEAKILREQYLDIERRFREIGRTTKRVQTLISKLKDNK